MREDIKNLLNIQLTEWASQCAFMGMRQRHVVCVTRLVDREDFPLLIKSLRLRFYDQQHTRVVFFVRRRDDSVLYRDLEKKAIDCISDNVV